jgi:alpha-glucoside transport system substrate-binding protein
VSLLAGIALAATAFTAGAGTALGQDAATPGVPTVPTGYAELDQALAPAPEGGTQAFAGKVVSVQVQYNGAELDEFEATLAPFEAATGIDISIESVGSNHEVILRSRVEGGSPPDISQIAQPAALAAYARDGKLVELSQFMDLEKVNADYAQAFVDLGSVEGKLYGTFGRADSSSTVWYPIKAFAAAGYEVPKTWEDLLALSDKIIADGNGSPWCISVEHGGATGWVATNWLENILLRTAPPETYRGWISHEVLFTDPAIKSALEKVSQVFFTPDYAYGGTPYILGTWVGSTMDPMFTEDLAKPACWMQLQAGWYGPSFFPDARDPANEGQSKYVIGEDVGLFDFPAVDPAYGTPTVGGGDLFMMFNDRPEVRAVQEFLATPESLQQWITSAGITAANRSTPAEWYAGNYKAQVVSDALANATALVFDASDSMPPEVGSGSFLNGMVEWISANGGNTDQILQAIDDSWPAD